MTTTGLAVFDTTIQETNTWLKRLMECLRISDRHAAYLLLRATLHAVRDRIGPENASHLGAQLPMLIRGLYYEGWRMSGVRSKERHVETFVEHVLTELPSNLFDDPEQAVCGALAVIRSMIDPGEALKVIHLFPKELRDYWLAARLA
jgi:uncharacterized protein (DUF2267 family)